MSSSAVIIELETIVRDRGIATPVTWELDGRQYLSVLSGTQSGRMLTFELDGNGGIPPQQ